MYWLATHILETSVRLKAGLALVICTMMSETSLAKKKKKETKKVPLGPFLYELRITVLFQFIVRLLFAFHSDNFFPRHEFEIAVHFVFVGFTFPGISS